MSAERFMQLVVENHGFEFVQAYNPISPLMKMVHGRIR